ncbi:hypothetical protein GPAL_1732 [Glaciecola pallidula DSM 14239 = ACAM 615]|jgi:hypothetical protein|uniref:Uncharacterized protein n=1 Tax=Brumicola pallidula DSM 14239 = ACAM 615 TaxID=1121922 RepID=K6ZZ81_9ALTE|nr:hypothetical protein GPAL_1732 [Glaciecola pallidula DSM 14239 = ACAM 615]
MAIVLLLECSSFALKARCLQSTIKLGESSVLFCNQPILFAKNTKLLAIDGF